MRQLIDSTRLDAWFTSTSRDAQELLPHLMRRLIFATTAANSLAAIRIPVADEIGRPGYDGSVQLNETHAYIPQGSSVWEMGVGDPGPKATDDYRERTGKPGEITPAETTFVFVTPHRWPGKDDWVKKRKDSNVWKDVRVLDDVDLTTWIEIAPGVGRWLARVMNIRVEHLKDLQLFWDEQAALYGVSVPPALAIGGRAAAVEEVRQWLDSDRTSLTIEGESIEEASCFIAACINELPEPARAHAESRLLFVDNPAGLEAIALRPSGLLVVPTTDETRVKVKTMRGASTRSLLPRGRSAGRSTGEASVLRLGTVRRQACEVALASLGLGQQASRQIAVASKGSFAALLWMVAKDLERPPAWTEPETARQLVPLLLTGQWVADREGDKELVAKVAGRSYPVVEQTLVAWAAPKGPLIRRGITWDWQGRLYAWRSLVSYAEVSQVDRFIETVVEALTTPDPKMEIEPEKRWASELFGAVPRYSGFILSGLVESVAYLAVTVEPVAGRNGQAVADQVVSRLLGGDAGSVSDRFLSLASFLPDLAEASPDRFLTAVETLASETSAAKQMFQELGLMSTSPQVYLLWGLERLAWSADLFTRVFLALGRLAAIDPGGSAANRPMRSLTELVLPWHPQSTVSLEHRLAAIDRLHHGWPDVAWNLAESLLPERVRFANSTASPQWRDWKPDEPIQVTVAEYWRFVQAVLERMLTWAGQSGTRWLTMADAYAVIAKRAPEIGEKLLVAIEVVDPTGLASADKEVLADGLRDLVARHRQYADAKWAMTPEAVSRIANIFDRVKPENPADLNLWLFEAWPRLPDDQKLKFEEHQRRLTELRRAAVEAVWQFGGFDAIQSFAERAESPEAVGAALAHIDIPVEVENRLLNTTLALVPERSGPQKLLSEAFAYCGQRYRLLGGEWLQELGRRSGIAWDANRWANLCWGLPPTKETWDFIQSRGEEADSLYWQRVPIPYLRQGGADLQYAAERLVGAGRPARFIFVVGLAITDTKPGTAVALPVKRELVVQALRDVFGPAVKDEWYAPALSSIVHNTEQLLDALEADGLDLQTLAQLEFPWLNALEHSERGPRALQRLLRESPEFFVEALSLVFMGEGEDRTEVAASQQAMASQVYRLLERWREVPGLVTRQAAEDEPAESKPPTAVDSKVLRDWIVRARELARQKGRLRVADDRIGNVLAHAPADPDGLWPCEGVRTVLEEVRSEKIDRGIEIGVFNKRGVYSASAGKDERAISDRYQRYAERLREKWPSTAAICFRIAESYAHQAEQEAKEAELEEFE